MRYLDKWTIGDDGAVRYKGVFVAASGTTWGDGVVELLAAAAAAPRPDAAPEPVGCFWCDYAKQHEGLVICATHGVHRPRFTLATQGKHLRLVDSGTSPARIVADLHLEADEANGFVTIANTGDTGQYDQNEPF